MSIKKIAILTSGGDSPGMNTVISSIISTSMFYGLEPFVVIDGYKGLVEDKIKTVDHLFAKSIISKGGTAIGSARLPEFAELSYRKKAVANLKARNIEALVVIGGDGSFAGALKLHDMGIKCIAIPGTIDNDIACSEYTIGFDTTLNTVVEATDKIRETIESHNRCSVIEVMGRHCGDIALYSGISCAVDIISIPEQKLSEEEIVQMAKKLKQEKKRSVIVMVTELLYDTKKLAAKIEAATGYVTRETVLSYTQRGGTPNARDRYTAFNMGLCAVEELKNGNSGLCVALRNNEIQALPIDKALSEKRNNKKDFIKKIQDINFFYKKNQEEE